MNQPLRYTILSLMIFSIASCSNSCSDDQTLFEETLNPTPPTAAELSQPAPELQLPSDVPEPKPLLSAPPTASNEPPSHFDRPRFSDNDRFISIKGQDGRLLTVWALARRNWLWGYAPLDSHSFGTIRNWKIERSFRREHFRFINQRLGTCIQAYGNGLIHDSCRPSSLDQDFELMPTSTGSVFIKSVSQQRCVTYNPVNTQGYATITLSKCDDNVTPLRDQNWFLSPPILLATPDTY